MGKIRFKLNELKIVSVVASCGSLSQAAIILGIAQANISKAITDFELRIGLKIFERTTRRISLTQFGESLLVEVNDYLNQTDDLATFISDYKKEKRGKVTLYAPTGIVDFIAQKVIAKFKDIGDIHLALRTANLDYNEFHEGIAFPPDADIVLTYAKPKDESLVACTLSTFPTGVYASPDYLARHPISTPDELVNHSCILLQSMLINNANIWRFDQGDKRGEKAYSVTGKYICDRMSVAIELARHGLGIVFALKHWVADDIDAGRLVPCFDERHQGLLELIIIFKKREYQPYRVQYILDQMIEIIHETIKTK
jgi:DNA-binding transcriptional LysR family regulator